ncbi:MAG: DUF4249 family protein [Bacteroidetes bacterium]|nr:DUF4249 family protein [Bacteroidota bacterium]
MKKIALLPTLFLVFTLLMTSCSTEVDNYADYKDISIVYGMVEPGVDTTWIKVTKAFLGPGNALLIAKIPDSSNYQLFPKVVLKRRKNNVDLPDIVLDTITINNKLAGDSVFYFPQQLMYFTTAAVDAAAEYTLHIEKANGETITATTPVVQSFDVIYPSNRINFHSTATGRISFMTAKEGKRYEVNLSFHYKELRPGNPDTLFKTMNWGMGMKRSVSLSGGEEIDISYTGADFYSRLGQSLENIDNVKRWAGKVDVTISCGADQLSTYIDVNAPSNSIVQEIPEFTNIENGYGIFSSRRDAVRTYQLAVGSELKLLEFNWGFVVNR